MHIAGIICHLTDFSFKIGRKLKWNPEKEIIIGDAEISKLMGGKSTLRYIITL